jgi:phage repressor protein C with HTH and peptisase S24 domain
MSHRKVWLLILFVNLKTVFVPTDFMKKLCEDVPMFRHSDIWRAIDTLAVERGLSPSGLARLAGLDPTTFNKSKRSTAGGKLRWPGTESIAKILDATGATLPEFMAYLTGDGNSTLLRRVPLIGLAQAGSDGYFDDGGYPTSSGWDEIAFPDGADPHAYALEVSGDSMEPVFRDGDIIIISPEKDVRRGDRVVAKSRQGEVLAKILGRMTATKVELKSINPDYEDREFLPSELSWISKIIWASQ